MTKMHLPGYTTYDRSVTEMAGTVFALVRASGSPEKRLAIAGPATGFEGDRQGEITLCPLSHGNAEALRQAVDWLRPRPLGLKTSAGCGDRLGLATPGHIHAARAVGADAIGADGATGGIAMILAQQSIREMTRTGRTPVEVMDDATWGTFQEGWSAGVGADADHLKTPADVDRCAAAGFTFYTIDPGDHVDANADTESAAALEGLFASMPWGRLECDPKSLLGLYVGKRFDLGSMELRADAESITRAAVKYSRAVAHTAEMVRHIASTMGERPYEIEVSVDETETPTTHIEHLFIVNELKRLGAHWVSLAPRYVGRFEKGVDYIGDLDAFERSFAGHAAIARAYGPYKLSLHSGSDKFSIYGMAAEHTKGLVHLKTAGTSYLEAVRATASYDPALFREIMEFSINHYIVDRATYHVSAELAKVPAPLSLADADLAGVLDQFDARQVFHVTFGSVLLSERGFGKRLKDGLKMHEAEHYAVLERHFIRHLRPLKMR